MKRTLLFLFSVLACISTFAAENKLYMSIPDQADVKNIKVELSLDNEEEFQGLEVNFSIPEGLGKDDFIMDKESEEYFVESGGRYTIAKMPITTGFKKSTPNTLFVSIVAVKTTTFTGNSGTLGYFAFDGSSLADGVYEVSFDKSFLLYDGDNSLDDLSETITFEIKEGKVTQLTGIKSSAITVDSFASDEKVNVYDILGHVVRCNVEAKNCTEGLREGVYVVNGKKVIVSNK